MPFMTGYFLLAPEYRSGDKRIEAIKYLTGLGYEIYDVGISQYLIYYLEAPSINKPDEISKAAEGHPGILKAFVAMGVMADDAKIEEIAEQLESGEIELDETAKGYLKELLKLLKGGD